MAGKKIRNRKSRSVTTRKDAIDPFDNNERQALINTATGQLKALVQFCFWTGLRLSELFALNWENVDWVNERIYVQGALTRHSKEIESTKTEAGERSVDLLQPAIDALRAQKAFTFLAYQEIFQNPHTGSRWTGDSQLRTTHWVTLLKKAGVRFRPRGQMRHTFASMTLMAGESPQWVASQMGHRDWSFTARVYYRWIPRDDTGSGKKTLKKWGKAENQ